MGTFRYCRAFAVGVSNATPGLSGVTIEERNACIRQLFHHTSCAPGKKSEDSWKKMEQSGNHIRQEQADELLRRLRRHEQAAFHELVDQHSQALFRVAYSMVANAADAEDAVQETFTAAFSGIGKFRGESTLRTWLMQILVRQCARVQRGRGRRMTIGIDQAELTGFDPSAATEAGIDVIEMLQKLSPEHREVIVLRELQGMGYEEMSQALKIPRGTVESRLHRARQELKERFGDRE
jgi:RNA polymerase sigma-70 factor (ECF subfamily)